MVRSSCWSRDQVLQRAYSHYEFETIPIFRGISGKCFIKQGISLLQNKITSKIKVQNMVPVLYIFQYLIQIHIQIYLRYYS